jgi:hypothetical protein
MLRDKQIKALKREVWDACFQSSTGTVSYADTIDYLSAAGYLRQPCPDNRQIADATNALRDEILALWPAASRIDAGRLRTVISSHIVAKGQPCPPGWVCVPMEPTGEMEMAGQTVPIPEECFIGDFRSAGYAAQAIYKAMLAAAPKPEGTK